MTNNSGTNWFETKEGKEAAGNIHVEISVPRGGVITAVKSETGTDFFIGYPCYNAKVVPSFINRRKKMDILKGYKSVVFFGLMLVIAVANLLGFGAFSLSPEQSEWFAVVVPLIGLVLRAMTNSPIFKSDAG